MGGQEGSRGYLYQAIIAIISACSEDDWSSISVECETENDKVDVGFFNGKNIVKAIQVKSSVNLFDAADIKNWIIDLTNDVCSNTYTLYLIGNVAPKSNTLIKSINQYQKDHEINVEMKKSLDGFTEVLDKHNVSIKLTPLDIDSLLAVLRDKINQFISKRGYTVDFEKLNMLSHAFISRHSVWSTDGQRIERAEYEEILTHWIEIQLNGSMRRTLKYSKLEIVQYDYKNESLVYGFKPIKLKDSVNYSVFFEKRIVEGRKLIEIIKSIKLSSKTETNSASSALHLSNNLENHSGINATSLNPFKSTIPDISAEFSNKRKDNVISALRKYWNEYVDNSFFCVGDLKKPAISCSFGPYGFPSQPKGKKEEIEKNEHLEQLETLINELDSITYIFEMIGDFTFLPLCITNSSDTPDQNISVSMNVCEANYQMMETINSISQDNKELLDVFADWIVEDDVIHELLSENKNDIVDEIYIPPTFNKDASILSMLPKQKDFKYDDLIENFWKNQAVSDESGNMVYEIRSLRPGETVWLQPFLIMPTNFKEHTIKYSILSDNSGCKFNGEINI